MRLVKRKSKVGKTSLFERTGPGFHVGVVLSSFPSTPVEARGPTGHHTTGLVAPEGRRKLKIKNTFNGRDTGDSKNTVIPGRFDSGF